ncbi:guanosine-diphosphatase [Penicillium diatomitis]|uniref:guanosine-diphosphatase n=1 Tax=Penicillium diatomitis TaxID=2819901 RepID=A0A9X0BYV9_9EURO|nr:guanosine-diphosphatase [Penicillium diatomitis]KAJ5491125.1 guanosine-diphosphatase [Penicillium diatomitis]
MSTGVNSLEHSEVSTGPNSFTRRRSVSYNHSSAVTTSTESLQSVNSPFKSGNMVSQSQKSRWIKTGAIVGFVFMLLLWLSPSKSTVSSSFTQEKAPSSGGVSTKCTKPFDSSKPLIQYALMIDAGSTGSRIHVYRFNNCGSTPELENEVFEQTKKKEGGSGLSSYREDAEGAARSLDPLMETALKNVPEEYRSCTPVAVKATAGLRLLGPELSKNILEAVRTRLETVYPFPVVSREKGGVQIMDGSDEGVYAWITTNYLLGKIGGPDETPTAAIFDLGGGSTQIVFQPTFEKSKAGGMPERLAEGDHKYELKFGGREFELYQHSHLGYGLMSAREAMNRVVLEAALANNPEDLSWTKKPVSNPCIQPNMKKEVTVTFPDDHPLGPKVTVTMAGPQDASPAAQCRAIAEKILKKDAECKLAPCSFNGIHQPSLAKTFSREDVYIFSYFFDRTAPLGMPSSFTLDELHKLTASVCGGEETWGVFEGVKGALVELRDRPDWCMDLNFMMGLLHTGYEMPLSREVKIAKKIKDNELGWCLGASLPLLSQESGWTCRIKEVS